MRTSILFAAAAVVTLALVGAGPPAEAQSGSKMFPAAPPHAATAHRYRYRAATAPKKKAAVRGYLPRSAAKGPGRCGTHMYWKGGKCHDARAPSK
jgi:hypothetical protein